MPALLLFGFVPLAVACSLLNLDVQPCQDDGDCSNDGSMMCVNGVCELSDVAVDATSDRNGDPTESDDDSMSSPITMTPGTSGETGDGTTGEGCPSDGCTTTEEDSADESTGPAPEPVPLVMNTDFETNISGWGPHGTCMVTSSSEWAHGGTRSAFVTGRTDTWMGAQVVVTNLIVEDVRYAVSGWVRLAGDTPTAMMQLSRKMTCTGVETSYLPLGMALAANDGWAQIEATLTVPNGCDASEVTLYFEGATIGVVPDATFLDFYVDDVVAVPD